MSSPVQLIDPLSGCVLEESADVLRDDQGNERCRVNGVYRMVTGSNYAESFGFQWNKFTRTQLESETNVTISRRRFFVATSWNDQDLRGTNMLEVGSGAGRFTQVVLEDTPATLYSVDYSNAVEANFRNNGHYGDRLKLFQASIYELPFADGSFDKVFCFGVLQHTPDFDASIKTLINKTKRGGEIVVDFYPIKGWWTKINAKYILRPFTKRMSHECLLNLITRNIDWLIKAHFLLHRLGLGIMTRFLPVCNIMESIPKTLTKAEIRELAILDTFDQYSPEHDHPQRIADVAKMFERHGATVTFAGYKEFGGGMFAAVVKGMRSDPSKRNVAQSN